VSRRDVLKYTTAGSVPLVAGCLGGGGGGDGGGGGQSLTIGSPLPLTGAFAPSGEDNRDAIEMAINDFMNGRENVEGNPSYVPEGQPEYVGEVDPLFQDTELDAQVGTRVMRNMIEQDNADFIVGGVSTSVTVGLAELARNLETMTVLTGTGNTQVTGENRGKWHFRSYLNAYNTSQTLTNYLVNEQDYREVFVVYSDYGWGYNHRDITRRVVEGVDGTIVNEIAVPFGTSDFSGQISQILNTEPDLAYMAVFDNDAINAVKQAHQAGVKENTDLAIPIHTVPQSRGLTQEALAGVWGTLKYYFTFDNENSVNFVNRFYDEYGRIPSSEASTGYKSMMEVLKAVERAESVDDRTVIGELEGAGTTYFKDKREYYRECDHQLLQPDVVGRGYEENPDLDVDVPEVDFPLVENVQTFTDYDLIFRACEDLPGEMTWD
jgi:branched-chain amino acid transport system substrate-binding protein